MWRFDPIPNKNAQPLQLQHDVSRQLSIVILWTEPYLQIVTIMSRTY